MQTKAVSMSFLRPKGSTELETWEQNSWRADGNMILGLDTFVCGEETSRFIL